jgi:hypothetical protein
MTAVISFGHSTLSISDEPLTAIIRDRYRVTLIRGACTTWGSFYHSCVWDELAGEFIAESRETCYCGYCVHEIMALEVRKLFPGLPADELPTADCERELD